ncbi:hypothetical protein KEM48_004006 [Puccinia striiformis f. sp. tritici PST-130]|nr:hypothetical protein Pst134EB_014824 [Puccinia striiformis f. sp. tritici]KAI9612930.1 hypothetical protein KEM48_004006 [Puccinia striiformis f. sp. tritici PST-130]
MSLTEDHDQVEQALLQTRRTEAIERSAELATSTIPLVKLARIFVTRLLIMIPNKRNSEPDTRINSETLRQFHNSFESITSALRSVVYQVGDVQSNTYHPITMVRRDNILRSVNGLRKTLETTSTNIASRLMPLLHGTEHTSPASDFKAWSLTLEQPWDKVVDHLSDLVSSFEVERAE